MRITTLGPLAVDGRPVRGDRLTAVIRELLDARGRTASTGALIDAVWSGAPPEDAVGAVQALVGRARRLGLPVLAAPGGYRIPADRVEIDAVTAGALVDRGRRALTEGDAAGARTCADEARVLFPEVPGETGGRLFGDVVTLRADAALAGGDPHRAGEADLRRLATRVPPDEPAAALLVRVLAAQGRDAEALDLVDRVRTALAERYGADPSPVLADAHLALLRGQLAIAGPRAAGELPAGWRRAATPLVGRAADLGTIGTALRESALVTVVATGGAGKTRLAAEIARAEHRPVHVVELAGLRSPGDVRPTVLAALPGTDTTGPVPGGAASTADAALTGLLVLDNCEHVLDAVATVVAELLAVAPPEFGVLATSRAPLGLLGERVHRLSMLPDDDALALLDARARAGGIAPAWDRDRALALCRRLDNLPLAIELAAARLRTMPIDDVLAGVALLENVVRGLPDRHASVRALTDWSRALLAPAEQSLLERLAVIPAPFTAGLAQAVAGGADVRPGLSILVEQSLLQLDEDRYRMLATVREYGTARLGTGAHATAMAGLVRWSRERAVTLAADFIGPAQVAALRGGAADRDVLVAALRWSLDHDDEPAAADIATALFQLWTVRGRHAEASAWAGPLLRLGDPAARRRSTILHGTAAVDGGALPHADRLAWLCVLIGLNTGITGAVRPHALARRALRTLFTQRPGDVSPRIAALATALPGPDRADAATLIAHPDPYVQGMGHFLRAVLAEGDGVIGDGELAYRRFEAVGDHWGMGMAAHAAGHATGAGTTWLRRSERHLTLVGAAEDARSTRALLDAQLALAGDAEAARRLLAIVGEDGIAPEEACQARLVLAQVAWRHARPAEALAHADALLGTTAGAFTVFRVAAAVIQLWAAEREIDAARAADVLRQAGAEARTGRDRPLLGAWATAGAELAAFRRDVPAARGLWALGTRAGAPISRFFPQGGGRLADALGGRESREPLLTEAGALSEAAVHHRVRALMDGLLR
ncbi:ATP-binding protein [Catenuloplanes japonicus]|uniref:ATP-binding protein n=1 Tax=Catenuloplanes japonicus TaxID=33876 RepID=UPI0005274C48|nr:BTAD domain-containing putative transcriptional regulator [Catenuloplanes japonicus]